MNHNKIIYKGQKMIDDFLDEGFKILIGCSGLVILLCIVLAVALAFGWL